MGNDNRLILLNKGLKSKDGLIPKIRHRRDQHSLAFQITAASTNAYKNNFFPRTIRDWNDPHDSLSFSAE